ncbi:MAG: recombination mediator RecR [Candidatus Saganbacteria bacterium]|nr:recombination mediator RecR [Candidatus Saganbacteria bacterium]
MPSHYPEPVNDLIEEFKKLPGIGPKSAQRLVFHILGITDAEVGKLAKALTEVKKNIRYCSVCFNLTVKDPCDICRDNSRDKSLLCVVAEPKDLIAIERTREFKGSFHVLGGLISPLDGVGPDNLRIKELLGRLKNGVKEVLVALNPTTESETTIFYLTKIIKPLGIRLTRIASGLPIGSDMDFADEATLLKAIEGRRELS